jgi:myosin heavy subunit
VKYPIEDIESGGKDPCSLDIFSLFLKKTNPLNKNMFDYEPYIIV